MRRRLRRKFYLWCISSLAAAVAADLYCDARLEPAWADEAPPLQAAVMATYLVKFGPFIEWPPSSFPSSSTPLTICVVGELLSRALDEAASGQRDGDHPIAVRHIATAAVDMPCHILFADGSPQQVAGALSAVKGKPVLTVTDQHDAASQKGIINFVIADNHVRFEIDPTQAVQAGLSMSSQLLSLAVNMRGR
ncbi:MAG: YfiR family protein [Stellaceae bacterium]